MSEFELIAGEKNLLAIECIDVQAPTPFLGEVTLTNLRLHFSPDRHNRTRGAEPWQINLDKISKINEVAGGRMLMVRHADGVNRIIGAQVIKLTKPLFKLVTRYRDRRQAKSFMNKGEYVLCQGTTVLHIDQLNQFTGQFAVTNKRIVYIPGPEAAGSARAHFTLNAAVEDLRAVQMSPDGQQLLLRVKSANWTFVGPGTETFYGAAICVQRDKPHEFINYSTSYLRTQLGFQKGVLFATVKRLLFCPFANSENKESWGHLHLRLSSADRISFVDGETPHLGVLAVDQYRVFVVPQPLELTLDLMGALIEVTGRDDPPAVDAFGSIAPEHRPRLLVPWAKTFEFTPGAALFCGPVIMITEGPSLYRGWLYLSAKRVIFIPAADGGEVVKPVVLDIQTILITTDLGEESPQLVISLKNHTLQFIPRGGHEFVHQFRELCQAERRRILTELKSRRLAASGPKQPGKRSQNRRNAYRVQFPVDVPVTVINKQLDEGDEGATLHAKATDLSESGLGLVGMPQPVGMGKRLGVIFKNEYLPGENVGCVVAQTKIDDGNWRIGIKWEELNRAVRAIVRNQVMEAQREELELRAAASKD